MAVNDVLTELSDSQDNSNLEPSFGSDTAATVCTHHNQQEAVESQGLIWRQTAVSQVRSTY